ncbi:hypothetical protein HYN69_00400 [Gemmobacter aquarius]|uniref:Uncharacterized protein n=1 Tax=Paragemmobacter aquarius TaxID=2169400 RepID=A0A2S0UH72_9RHOB|nr:hypothetical protein HYN69_00400 [Gemmobacter aquarius]
MLKSPVAGVPLALKIRPSMVIVLVSSDKPSLTQTAINRPSAKAVMTAGLWNGETCDSGVASITVVVWMTEPSCPRMVNTGVSSPVSAKLRSHETTTLPPVSCLTVILSTSYPSEPSTATFPTPNSLPSQLWLVGL